jgi:hypothetical protein
MKAPGANLRQKLHCFAPPRLRERFSSIKPRTARLQCRDAQHKLNFMRVWNCKGLLRFADRAVKVSLCSFFALAMLTGGHTATKEKKQDAAPVPDMSGKYHFLSPDDTLALLEEEGTLKGYIDVFQNDEESDAVFSYPIAIGSRQGDHVEFKTGKIHERYYRFSGTVERGSGAKRGDPDYLELTGDLEIITANSVTNTESAEKKHVVLKSLGKDEQTDEDN